MKKHIGIFEGEEGIIEALRTGELYKPWLAYDSLDGSLHNTDIMFIEGTLDGDSDCVASIAWTGATLTATFDCYTDFYYNVVTNDDLEFSVDSGYTTNATIYVTAGTNSDYSARTLSFDIEFRQEEEGSVYYTLHYVITQEECGIPRVFLSGELYRFATGNTQVPYFAYNTESINISTTNLSDDDSYTITMRNGSSARVSLTSGTGNINYALATMVNTTTGVRTFNGADTIYRNDIQILITANSANYTFDLAPVLLPNNAGIFKLGNAGDAVATASSAFNTQASINYLLYTNGDSVDALSLTEVSGDSYRDDWTITETQIPIGYEVSVKPSLNWLEVFTMELQADMTTGETLSTQITKNAYADPAKKQAITPVNGIAYTHTGVEPDESDTYYVLAGVTSTSPRVQVGVVSAMPTDTIVRYNPVTEEETGVTGHTNLDINQTLPKTATTAEFTYVGDGNPFEVTVIRDNEEVFWHIWTIYRAPNAPCFFREDAPLDGDLYSVTGVTFKSIVTGSYTLTSVSGAPETWVQTIDGNDFSYSSIGNSGESATTTITATYTDANENTATYSIEISYYIDW